MHISSDPLMVEHSEHTKFKMIISLSNQKYVKQTWNKGTMEPHPCISRVNARLVHTCAQMFTLLPQRSNLYDKSNLTNQTCFLSLCDFENYIFRNEYATSILT